MVFGYRFCASIDWPPGWGRKVFFLNQKSPRNRIEIGSSGHLRRSTFAVTRIHSPGRKTIMLSGWSVEP